MTRLALACLVVGLAACRPLPPPRTPPPPPEETAEADPRAGDRAETPAARDSLVISPRAAAIIDSIEAAVRDSFANLRAEQAAALARADSVRAAARADSIAAAEARRDSLAAATRAAEIRRDSLAEAARQDSVAAAARRDSLARLAVEDSVAAARIAEASVSPPVDPEAAAEPESEAARDLEELRALGPSYIPYDQGPETIWNTEIQARLTKTLLPVLRAESLPATTRTIFWVLVSREGAPVEIRLQTTSSNAAFDAAAQTFLESLTFLPAIRSDRPVASWVLREISMLMQ